MYQVETASSWLFHSPLSRRKSSEPRFKQVDQGADVHLNLSNRVLTVSR
jgi:hypothetical protein